METYLLFCPFGIIAALSVFVYVKHWMDSKTVERDEHEDNAI